MGVIESELIASELIARELIATSENITLISFLHNLSSNLDKE